VPGISGTDPASSADGGGADARVTEALRAFWAGQGGEHDALAALAESRLLVPVVAVPVVAVPGTQAGDDIGQPAHQPPGAAAGEKVSEMAMPTLIGMDGRRAIPAFTCLASLQAWQADARPVPAQAAKVWQAAVADSCAVVIDVAGPVPLAVEGVRLDALARGEQAPPPCADSDVRDVVAGVLEGELAVAGFELRPGGQDHDLVIALTLSEQASRRDAADPADLAAGVGNAVMARLGGRLRRGIAIWLDRAAPGGTGATA
jgi:SseB protein N-terminal domain